MMDLFLTNTKLFHKTLLIRTADNVLYVSNTNFLRDNKVNLILSYLILIDGLELFGLLVDYCLFGLSFWRHPFTAVDPLVSK